MRTSVASGAFGKAVEQRDMIVIHPRRPDDDEGVSALRLRSGERVRDERLLPSLDQQLRHPTAAFSQRFREFDHGSRGPPRSRDHIVDAVAFDAGLRPLLCLTKSDLAPASSLLDSYGPLGVDHVVINREEPLDELRAHLRGRVSVLVGHSGVGKSTMVNALVPGRSGSSTP